MIEENKEEIIENEEAAVSDYPQKSNRKPIFVGLAIIGVVVLGAVVFWLLRNREGGQAVPAPRNVSFDSNNNEQTAPIKDEQTITIEPEQVERIGIKIETVGETMSSEAAEVAATGVVQPNAYNETPVISLVGGVVRKVNAELGQNVNRGQTVAVIFSDELAAAQSRYLALQTETQTARQNYDRAAKLLKINPVSRAELDEAQAKLKTKEAELDEDAYDATTEPKNSSKSARQAVKNLNKTAPNSKPPKLKWNSRKNNTTALRNLSASIRPEIQKSSKPPSN